jgi:hypothetical protein
MAEETFELRNVGGKQAVNVVLQTPSVLSFVNVETGEAFSTYLTETAPIDPIADLTENAGVIGGTNDGNLPSLTIAALTENGGAIGGSNDGNLPDLTTPTAALACEAVREVAVKSNAVAAATTASLRELATRVNEIQAALRTLGLLEE